MTARCILDENVVIYAQRGLDQNDIPNLDCTDLVNRMIDDEFHTIVVDDVLWDKYDDQLNNPAYYHSELGPFLMIRLWELLQTPGKVDGLGHIAPEFPEEHVIPPGSRDDVFIVRLAVEEAPKDTILVTTDRPLRSDLATSGIQDRYNLHVLSPQDALAAL